MAAHAGLETVVVDLDEQMLAEAHRPAVQADLTALPLATGSLDAAAAVNCLYQLPDEQAITDYLHGFNVPDWETRVDAIKPPLNITKRGAHVWAQRRRSEPAST